MADKSIVTSAVDGLRQLGDLGLPIPHDLQLVGELGRGAQCVVHRVRRDGADYAVKTLLHPAPGLPAAGELRREAALLAWINHPNLVKAYETGTVRGQPYLIMEMVEGSDLAAVVRRAPMPVAQVTDVGRQVAAALGALHQVGLVHRDVKPTNIVLQPGGQVRLLDLGLAIHGVSTPAGAHEPVAGTLAYAAPEQSGMLRRSVDARSDLYALGAVLYECLTGHPPYEADEIGELLRQHASAPVPDPRHDRPEVPARLAEIVAKLLAKDPDDRYQSAEGVALDLERGTLDPAGPWRLGSDDTPVEAGRSLPLVGRDPEYVELVAAWKRTRQGQGEVAVIHGGTGTGKTRLAAEIAGRVRSDGAPVLTARCGAGDPPLGALRGAVEAYVRSVQRFAGEDLSAGDRPSPRIGSAFEAPQETPVETLVEVLADIAGRHGGALLSLDDAEHLDEATRGLLRLLALRLPDTPLLVLLGTSAPDGVDVPAQTDIPLGDLGADAIRALVTQASGHASTDDLLIERILARGARTPLEVREYLAAIFDAGLLTPHWGEWRLDVARLDTLALPHDVLDLIRRRLDTLTDEATALLSAAALIGTRFPLGLAAAAGAVTQDDAVALLRQASDAGVLEARDGEWAFTHDCLRTVLHEALPEAHRRDLHDRIAACLSADLAEAERADPETVYAVARHCAYGRPERDPVRTAGILLAAGRRALADNAPMHAVTFLRLVPHLAELAGQDGNSEPSVCGAREALAGALHAAGSFAEAIEMYEQALQCAPGRVDRARILLAVSQVHRTEWRPTPQLEYVGRTLRELGIRHPEKTGLLLLTSLGSFSAGLFVALTKCGCGTRRPERRDRHRRRATVYAALGSAAIQASQPVSIMVATLRQLYPAARLGDSPEFANALAHVHVLLTVLGARRYSGMINRAVAVAERLGDPRLRSRMVWTSFGASVVAGRTDKNALLLQQAQNDRDLPLMEYVTSIVANCAELLNRGHVEPAGQLYEQARRRVTAADLHHPALALVDIAYAASQGRIADADTALGRVVEDPAYDAGMLRSHLLAIRAHVATEQRDLGDAFDGIVPEAALLGTRLPTHIRPMWVPLAYGRIEQCRTAPADRQPAAQREAAQAVATLGKLTNSPDMAAHHTVAQAYLFHLRGDHERALAALNRADRELRHSDTPLALYEAARLRARALAALGQHGTALAQARAAASLATTHGWPHRVGWLRAEFPELARTDPRATAGPGHSTRHSHLAGGQHLLRRRLAAIEQISLAASRVLDPAELTRIALDEAIRLLGADRAFLFLAEGDNSDPATAPRLIPHLGRDSSGADIGTLTGYGSTLVETVRTCREPLVVTSTDEGAALGSQSAVMYGLRSMIVAPMVLEGRLVGVIYLDSRIAKGMFATEDLATLSAITNHVAAALETARAAQLALAVRAAEERRDTSEMIRRALADLTGTLDPRDVLTRLAASVRAALPADQCRLVTADGDGLHLHDMADAGDHRQPVTMDQTLRDLLHTDMPTRGGPHDLPLLPGMRSWLAVPLHARQDDIGLILLGTADGDTYQQSHLDLASTLACQGMVAYDNARLFSQVSAIASIDELTGIPNRRQFFELARRQVAASRRHGGPLAALMVDIDHFKNVNDTHGHRVGDQVIHAVANRMASTIRDIDVLGRYGGEEFALLLDIGQDATTLAERIRTAVGDTPIGTDAGELHVTVSVGVTWLRPADPGIEGLLSRADQALYRAKKAGRDQVIAD